MITLTKYYDLNTINIFRSILIFTIYSFIYFFLLKLAKSLQFNHILIDLKPHSGGVQGQKYNCANVQILSDYGIRSGFHFCWPSFTYM